MYLKVPWDALAFLLYFVITFEDADYFISYKILREAFQGLHCSQDPS